MLQPTPIDTFRTRLTNLSNRENFNEWEQASCPAHNDKNRSLSFKKTARGIAIKCFAGCSREAILLAANLTEQEVCTSDYHWQERTPLTVEDIAWDKLLHPNFLRSLGLDERGTQVIIPYYDEQGQPYSRYRIRFHTTAKEGSKWNSESKDDIIPYGLHRLDMARDKKCLVIVEGESDCWTLWFWGIPALGLPGADNVACLDTQHLEGIERVYVMQEPDKAGKQFPSKVKAHLTSQKYAGKIYALSLPAKDPNDLHKQDIKGFKAAMETALLQAKPLFAVGKKPKIHKLRDLQKKVLPDIKWTIPGILPEGFTLLTGKPKLGKSWLVLGIGLATAAVKGIALGKIPVEQGDVLYLALEDNERRLQKRANIVLGYDDASERFDYAFEWPRMDDGGLDAIEEWIVSHPEARLIIIDTWAKFKPRAKNKNGQQYDEDYDAMVPVQQLAAKYGVSIVAVHHNRKMQSDDVLDEVAGSTGQTGASDGFLVLRKPRGATNASLYVTGRDIEVEQEYILNFNRECATWTLEGDASEFAKTPERQAILDTLKPRGEAGMSLKDLAEHLGKNENTLRNLLAALRREEKVLLLPDYKYAINIVTPSNPSNPSNLDDSIVTPSNLAEETPLATPEHEPDHEGYYANNTGYYGRHLTIVTSDEPVETVQEQVTTGYYGYYDNITEHCSVCGVHANRCPGDGVYETVENKLVFYCEQHKPQQ